MLYDDFRLKTSHILPKRSGIQRLHDFIIFKQASYLFQGEQMNGKVFGIFQMLMVYQFHICGKKTMRQVGVSARIGGNHHIFLPVSFSITRFLPQFTLGGH